MKTFICSFVRTQKPISGREVIYAKVILKYASINTGEHHSQSLFE